MAYPDADVALKRARRDRAQLGESEARFRSAFDYAPIGMALIATNGQWLEVNEAICKMLGYSKQELLEKTFQDLTHPEDLDLDLARIHEMLRLERDSYHLEKRYFHKQGSIIWVSLSVSAIYDELGEVSYFISQLVDMSQRRQMEALLEANEQKLKRAQRVAHLGYWEWTIETGQLIWSDELYALYGLEAGTSVSYQRFLNCLHPNDREQIHQLTELARTNGLPYEHVHRVLVKGEERFIQEFAEVDIAPDGKARRIFGTATDITSLKRAEQKVRESDTRFRSAFDNAAIGMAVVADSGRYLEVNQAFCDMVDYSEAELLNLHFHDITHLEDLAEDVQRYEQSLRQGYNSFQREKRFIRKDGSPLWVLLTVAVVRDSKGGILYQLNQVVNIQQRKQTLEQLKESEARYRTILHIVSEGIVMHDARGTITESNSRAEEVLGLSRKQLMGRTPLDPSWRTVHEDLSPYPGTDHPAFVALRTGDAQENKIMGVYRPTGDLTWLLVNANPLRLTGQRVEAVIVSFADITPLMTASNLLQERAKQLEQSNRDLQEFAYVASHDLQEPLRMISNYLQLLERRYKDKLDTDAHEFIDFAVDGAKRMQRLINDLLMLSRVGTTGQTFTLVDSEEILRVATLNLSIPLVEKAARVTHEPLPTVWADKTQLGQLLQNLIGNALKFSRDVPRIHLSVQDNEREWQFSVQDNGIGIAAQHQERIFVPFQRLHTREEFEGSGIGLALCRRIAERHGGRIWVESQPGEGATFYFTLSKERHNT
jgi:PAS domain S-box-containing protein